MVECVLRLSMHEALVSTLSAVRMYVETDRQIERQRD